MNMAQPDPIQTQKDKYPHIIEEIEVSVKLAGIEPIVFRVADRELIAGLWGKMRSWLGVTTDNLHDTPTIATIRPAAPEIRQPYDIVGFDGPPPADRSDLPVEGPDLRCRGDRNQEASGSGSRDERRVGDTWNENDPNRSVQTSDVRSWARQNGFDVRDRGRIPRQISLAYANALKNP